MTARLRIGLAACFFHADPARPIFKGKTLLYLEESLAHWIMRAGAVPFLVPTAAAGLAPDAFLRELDGLVLQGGDDVEPGTYGQEPLRPGWSGDAVRDRYELDLLRASMELDRPVLGVCRGAQLINVAFGGTLFQDIATEMPAARTHRDWEVYDELEHDIVFEPDAWLRRLYPGRRGGTVKSVHHQAVRDPGVNVRVEARADDGVVEAIRYDPPSRGGPASGERRPDGSRRVGPATGSPFVYGVQWHPEFQGPSDERLLDPMPVLEWFLEAAEERRACRR